MSGQRGKSSRVRFGAALVSWIPLFFLEGMRELANEPFRWTGAAGRDRKSVV